MIHTYRNEAAFESELGRWTGFFILLAIVALLFVVFSTLDNVETQSDWFSTLLLIIGLSIAAERHNRRNCREIRLSDDGICELETKRRITHLHVNEIRSVTRKKHRGRKGIFHSYVIRFQGGKLDASEDMTGMADFFDRLKTLNPALELINFSTDTRRY